MTQITGRIISFVLLCMLLSGNAFADPSISGLSPTSGVVGESVAIAGASFGAQQGSSTVSLNGTNAVVVSWSDTNIVALVPSGAQTGPFAVSINGQLANSPTFSVIPLPVGWIDTDIGTVGLTGSAAYTNGVFNAKGAGISIGNSADGFHFVYQQLTGDGTIVARVATLQGATNPQAGVMIRETLNPGSIEAFVSCYSSQAYFIIRTTANGSSTSQPLYSFSASPYWVKLTRSGNYFSAYVSADGFYWLQVGSTTTISMASSIYFGLAVSADTTTTLETATFDNVSTSQTSALAPIITNISATTGAVGSQVTLTGNNFGAGQGGSQVTLHGIPMSINSWSNTSIVSTIPAGASSGSLLVVLSPSMNDSNPVIFSVTSQPLPSGWLDGDLGVVGVSGSATYSNGVFTVKGGGGLGGTADGLHFVYVPLAGDGSIVARVASMTGQYTQAGVMIRESLSPASTFAFATFYPSRGFFYDRPTTGASVVSQTSPVTAPATPFWTKLVRSGNSFSSFISNDGFTWTQIGTSTTILMASNVYVGLMVAGGNSGTLQTATFDYVTLSSASAPAPVITGLSATTASVGAQVTITGSNFGTIQGGSAVTVNGLPMTINQWSDSSIVFTVPAGATSGPVLVVLSPSMNVSNRIGFTVTDQPLPSAWLDADIGSVSGTGSGTYLHGAFTIKSGGVTIGGTADGFHFVYLPLTGDGSITARVANLQGVTSPQVGVMIRETLGYGSIDVFANFSPNQAILQSRSTTGASATSQWTGFSTGTNPYWLRLARTGNVFSGYISTDGFNWTQIGPNITVVMASNAYIGLAVANGGSATLETATFDNVSVGMAGAPAPVISSLSATMGPIGSQITITGNNFGSVQNGSFVLLNDAPLNIISWSNTSIVVTVPVGATSGFLVVCVAPSMINSNPVVFAVTSQPVPSGWLDGDFGVVFVRGSATYSNGVFTVKGAGSIGSTADGLHFVYQSMTGDGSIVARVASLQGSPQMGVMIRESLSPSSTVAYTTFYPNQSYFYDRPTTGASMASQATSVNAPAAPFWAKLIRSGNSFTAFISADGFNWTQVGTSATVAMASNVYVGLAVGDGGSGSLATATFDYVSISSSAAPAPVVTALSATTAAVGTQVSVSGSHFGALQGASLVTVNSVPMTINQWSDTSIVFTVPAGATSGLLTVSVAPTMNDSNPLYFAVTSQPLPNSWLDLDIGVLSAMGSATYSAGTFTIKGAGGIDASAEAFHFVYQPLLGDGSITARFATLQGGQFPQAGVMIRETLDPASKRTVVYFYPNQAYFSYRSTTGGSYTIQPTTFSSPSTPYWVRIIRNGNVFSAYISTNGTTWTQVGTSQTIAMSTNVYMGLAVSGGGGSLETATVDNVLATIGSTPFVSGVTPVIGGVGTQVTISGSNFGASQGTSTVSFNGSPATSISSWNASQVMAQVPSTVQTGTGPVTITVNSITSNANVVFTAINPVISNLAPASGAPGGTVYINGSGFGVSYGTVYFNGLAAPTPLSWSDTSIKVQVPSGATTGPVTVVESGVTSAGAQFTMSAPPVITGISPSAAAVGSSVTLTGSGFGATQSSSTVNFNGMIATVTGWSDSQIIATVPDGALSGPVGVKVAALGAEGPVFTVKTNAYLTDSLGNQTTYTFDNVGGAWNVTQIQGSGCSSCTMRGNAQLAYDTTGNLLSSTDANSHTTSYTYDTSANMLSQSALSDAGTVTTAYTYNSFGEVLTMTDPLGNATTNTYDAKGNLLSVSTPKPDGSTAASVAQFTYDTKGQLATITDSLNNVTHLAYTATGLIQSITDAQNQTTSYNYDARGNRTSVIDPVNGSAHPTTFTYDIMNRLTSITYPDNTSVSFGYDTRGRRTSVTDQNNRTTTYAYDDADRLSSVLDSANNQTTYNYDTESNLISITDANNHTTSFDYDANGRVTKTTFPSTLYETYAYDLVGNLTSKTDRKNQAIQYVYDALNRLTQKSYPDSTNVDYVYDLAGKIKQVTDPTGTYSFAYDNMGRLIGTTTQYAFLPGSPFSNAYTYDTASNRKSLTAPDGSITTYGYDTLNRLNGMANSWAGSFGFSYDALSRRTQLTRPNGINTNYGYDSVSRLLSVLHQAGSTTIDGASYLYDNAGNRTSKTNYLNNVTEGYNYDLIYQLTQVTQGASTTESYTYDAAGNRLSSLSVPTYNYNSSNELTSTSNGSYTYDNNGNTLTDVSGKSYTWDVENRLVQAVVPGNNGGTTTFEYDPFGRRIRKSGPLGITNYLYDGPNLIEELDQSGNILARYNQDQGIDQPLAELRSGTTNYYEQDGIGSVTALTNSNGALASTYTYDSFGKLTASTGLLINPIQYAGRESDSETGIYEYRHRYYDPSVGRFLTEDPTEFNGGVNFYAYVRNQPTRATDPFGLVTVTPLPSEHVHTLPDIDPNCGITAGGCNKVDYRPDFTCEKGPNCKWVAKFTVRLVGDIYVASGPFPYKGRQPGDRSVTDTASALAHENQHTNDKLNAILPIFQRVEGMSFDSEADCQNAAANAEVQAAPAWARAAADSQRRRH